jgi:membrane protein DedA with SNARE-associated domain
MALLEQIISWALAIIAKFGYGGLFVTMGLESALIPIPSEVVLPFCGFLASSGKMNLWLVVIVATLANLVASILIFYVGYFGGRPLVRKYGKYVFIHEDDIERMDNWVGKNGEKVAFFSRLLPGVRGFSSLVLGVTKINFKKFFIFTFLGSFVWNLPLAYIGFITGKNWNLLHPYFQKFEFVILGLIIIALAIFIYKHIGRFRKQSN